MADTVTVRIVADASQLKTESAAAASAVREMGAGAEAGAEKMEHLEHGLAHVTTHLVGHAIPGMGRMSRAIGHMGESAIGVGPFLAAMIPVAALVVGIEIYRKLEEAHLKAAEEAAKEAVSEHKLADETVKLQEKLTSLTQGPLAASIQEYANLGRTLSGAETDLEEFNKKLEEHASSWRGALVAVRNFYEKYATIEGAAGTAKIFTTTKDLQIWIAELEKTHLETKDLGDEVEKLRTKRAQIASEAGPQTAQQLKDLDSLIEREKLRIKNAELTREIKQHEIAQAVTKEEDRGLGFKHNTAVADADYKKQQKLEEEGEKLGEELTAAMVAEADKQLAAKRTADEAVLAADAEFRRKMADLARTQEATPKSKLASIAEEQAAIKERLAFERESQQTAYAEDLRRYAELEAKKVEIAERAAEQQKQMIDRVTTKLGQATAEWATGQRTFTQIASAAVMQWERAFITALVRMMAQQLIMHILHIALTDEEKKKDAGAAAVAAGKAAAQVPVIGWLLAPIAAAATFATLASFDQGGIMGETGAAMLHRNEMVLPPHISQFVQNAAKNATPEETGPGGVHLHYNATVNTIDASGAKEFMDHHGEMIAASLQRHMRGRNAG